MSTPHPLAGSTLFVTARSPFARRVRVVMHELGIPFEEQVENILEPTADLIARNPLARVPTLVTPDGELLVESGVILQHVWDGLPEGSSLRPTERAARRRADLFSGLAAGLCDKCIEYYFERMRPEPHQDPAVIQEVRDCAARTLQTWERALEGEEREHLVGDGLTHADLDVAIALTYLDLRVDRAWKTRFPGLAGLQERVEARESFRRTAPPPL